MSESVLMPRGLVRECTKSCGYRAFTLHTGHIPCTTPGCDGALAFPKLWPHVCRSGHAALLPVITDPPTPCVPEPPYAETTICPYCTEQETRTTR